MDNNYDAIIIGSGVGGLTCGNLLAKHGMKTLIPEQHFQPGGYCTSYKRKGYLFDVPSVISNMRKGDKLEQLLSYIGVTKRIEFLEIDKLVKIVTPDIEIDWYSDTYKLEYEFISKFPEDRKDISKFFKEIREVWDECLRASYNPNLLQMLTYPLRFPKLVKYNNYTLAKFLDKFFKNENLKELLGKEAETLCLSKKEISALLYIAYMMAYAQGGIWYPKGGFQKISDAFVDCFKEYGGTLKLKTKVKKILIEDSRAIGIELDSGEKIYAKYIVSNADTKKTFLDLIDPKNITKKFRNKLNNLEQSMTGFVVKLAAKIDMKEFYNYAWISFCPEYDSVSKMLNLAKEDKIDLDNYGFSIDTAFMIDKDAVADGISVFDLRLVPVPYNYKNKWLSNNKEDYNKLKEEVAQNLIKKAEKFLPGLSDKIVVKDIATPLTYERYTSATRGAWLDLALTPKQAAGNRMNPRTHIKGLYLTGSKSFPAPGLSGSIPAGLYTADQILKGKLTKGTWCLFN